MVVAGAEALLFVFKKISVPSLSVAIVVVVLFLGTISDYTVEK